MTESEFLALGPRERDALVAKEVMEYPMGECLRLYWVPLENTNAIFRKHVPQFATDIDAAWQVVEKMREGGFIGGVYLPDPKAKRYRWYATFGNTSLREGYAAYGDAASFAICLAALRAKGVMR